MTNEFICERCGIRVIQLGEDEPHPENVLCLQCRFIEGLDTEADKKAVQEFLDKIHNFEPPAENPNE